MCAAAVCGGGRFRGRDCRAKHVSDGEGWAFVGACLCGFVCGWIHMFGWLIVFGCNAVLPNGSHLSGLSKETFGKSGRVRVGTDDYVLQEYQVQPRTAAHPTSRPAAACCLLPLPCS